MQGASPSCRLPSNMGRRTSQEPRAWLTSVQQKTQTQRSIMVVYCTRLALLELCSCPSRPYSLSYAKAFLLFLLLIFLPMNVSDSTSIHGNEVTNNKGVQFSFFQQTFYGCLVPFLPTFSPQYSSTLPCYHIQQFCSCTLTQ